VAKRRTGSTVGQTLGGIVGGFDQLVFRTTPPVQELVAKARPLRAPSGDGGTIDVTFPSELEVPLDLRVPDPTDLTMGREAGLASTDAGTDTLWRDGCRMSSL
jgi:hypothetical protein